MHGYRFSLQDNDSYAFRDRPAIDETTPWYELHQSLVPNMSGAAKPGVRRCSACGELLDKWNEPLTGLVIKKRGYDLSGTYDGVLVASEKFKEVCESNKLSGLRFTQLPDDPAFYEVESTEVVMFDAERRKTRFENQCPVCGQFESIIGATPVFLKPGSSIAERGFARTDLEFASGDEKHPLLLCGYTAGQTLMEARLKGVELESF